MRQQNQLLFSRTRVRSRYAVLPQEGIPASRLPNWPDVKVYVQTSPAMGSEFVQYRIELAPGQEGRHQADGRIEYRLGYYMIGVKPRMAGKWTWGQYATLIPASDFRALIRQAQQRDWI